jgi:hypothetical protein
MTRVVRFPFDLTTAGVFMPYISVQLFATQIGVQAKALLNTGAMVNVIPKQIGERLGLDWSSGKETQLGGNLALAPARAFKLRCAIQGFEPVDLAFNWSMLENVPIILGQFDFFKQFDVCFSYSENEISIRSR